MKSLFAAAMLLLIAAGAVAAPARPRTGGAAAKPFRLEHALMLRSYSDPTWSPDGRRLAYVVGSVDTAENTTDQDVWLVDLAEGREQRLTRHPKNDLSPTFSATGDTIAFVANRGSGDDARPAIWMMSLRGGEPWAFGSYDEAVGEVEWSPNGRWLAYVKTDTLPKQVREWRKKKWDHVVEDQRLQYPQLWIVEIATGRQRRLTSGDQYLWHVRWAPDSRSLAFITSPSGKPDDQNLQDIGIVPVEGGPVRKLDVIGTSFAWSPDGRWIALATGTRRDVHVEKADLWVVPATAGAGRPVNLTADYDEDANTPAWNPTSDTLFFHTARGITTRLAAVPRAGGPVRLGMDFESVPGTLVANPRGTVTWIESRPTVPAEIVVADRAGIPGRTVTSQNAAVAGLALGHARSFRWTSTDGVPVEGVLLRPPDAPEKAALKTLVVLHGGPYGDRYALSFQPAQQFFAAHGYQMFMPNFRSSGGYGTAFMMRKRADWGGQDWLDVQSGIDSLVRAGLADGKRLAVYGGSYGGYLSAWAITRTDRFDAASVFAGAVDLGAHFGQSDIQQYRAYDFEGYPWENENWRRASPITHIARAKTPTLILIGEDDRRVPYPQGQALYRALLALKVPTEFVHYPREGHGLREYRHRWDQHARMLAWFDRWVK